MKLNKLNRLAALLVAAALSASLMACGAKPASSAAAASSEAAASAPASSVAEEAAAITVTLHIVDGEQNTTDLVIETAEGAVLGDVMLENGLISQEEHDAGFFTVLNGIEANWDADQSWWCVKDADGDDSMVGIAEIVLEDGAEYSFVYTIGY